MNNNIFLKKLIKEALNELGKKLNMDSLPGDEEGFDFDEYMNNSMGDPDEYNPDAEYDEEEIDSPNKNRRNGHGLTKTTHWDKANAQRDLALRNVTSPSFEKMMRHPKIKDLYTHKNLTNPYNRFDGDDYKPNMFGRIQVTGVPGSTKKYGEPVYIISMYNIDPNDVHELSIQLLKRGRTLRAVTASTRDKRGKDGITLVVPQKNLDMWKEEEIPFIIDFLKENNTTEDGKLKYGSDENFENLRNYLENRIFTTKDVDSFLFNVSKNFSELLKNFMESENDEEVRAILEAYSRYNISEEMCKDLNIDASYGHILSWTNVKTVMCSGRNATFILPEKTWLRCFGRLVKPNAKPFFINVPSNKNWKGKWKNQTALPYTYTDPKDGTTKTVNISSTEDILNIFYEGRPYDELSTQQRFKVNTLANELNVRNTTRIPEYDVSDTVWDPNLNPVDVFNEEIGLLNNLTGELNAKAKEDFNSKLNKQKSNLEDTEETIDVEETDAKIAMELQRTKVAFKNLSAFARKNDIHVSDGNGDITSAFVVTLINAAKKLIPKKIGVTNPTEVERLANNIVHFICVYLKIGLKYVAGIKTPIKVDSSMLSEIDIVVTILLNAIERSSEKTDDKTYKTALEEGRSDKKDDDLHTKIHEFFSELNKEAEELELKRINESFYSLLQRMDNSKNNLL